MTFSLYALLNDESPLISNESLAVELKHYFRNEEKFTLELEHLPFSKSATLALRWGAWLVRVAYEEGDSVRADSREIQSRVSTSYNVDVSEVSRRIRVVFGSDDEMEFTNEIIYVIDFLKEIKGVLIFDPQRNDFV